MLQSFDHMTDVVRQCLRNMRACTLAHHLSLRSSMVRASYRSSEGCGFDPRLGLRNHFLSIELEDRSSTL